MEKLRLRCPTCSKLYEVCSSDIKSHSPQFDCVSCATRFTIELPVQDASLVKTQIVEENSFKQVLENQTFEALRHEIKEAAQTKTTKACPKCGALNDKKLEECYSCHVLFSRLEELPLDPTLRAQPSLVRKWKNLVLNFDNTQLHEDFLKSCHELEALRFAILKYEELQKAQGGQDEVCTRMIFKAQGLLQVTLSSKKAVSSAVPRSVTSWHKYVMLVPLMISITMIMMGFFSLSPRNLTGAGVALLLLTFGLVLFWKGRISLSDFIN